MRQEDVTKYAAQVLGYRNVIGFSSVPMPKEKGGVITEEDALRIYVSEKVDLNQLRDEDILPMAVEDFPVDVVRIGYVYAVPPTLGTGRRDVIRPLVSGLSVGNWAITAGTQGTLARYTDNNIYAMSNAHVYTPDPSKEPNEVTEKRIIQPGKHDGGTLSNKVGEYFWHDRIYASSGPSTCPVSNSTAWTLNSIARLLGRKSRFSVYVEGDNHQDLAAMKLDEGIEFDFTKTYDFPLDDYDLTSRIFAGSDSHSILCKLDYQLASGFTPIVSYTTNLMLGDTVRKSGRTTYDTTGIITDLNAVISINYGNFIAVQKDVVVTTHMCSGGDSGSDVFKELNA